MNNSPSPSGAEGWCLEVGGGAGYTGPGLRPEHFPKQPQKICVGGHLEALCTTIKCQQILAGHLVAFPSLASFSGHDVSLTLSLILRHINLMMDFTVKKGK